MRRVVVTFTSSPCEHTDLNACTMAAYEVPSDWTQEQAHEFMGSLPEWTKPHLVLVREVKEYE